MNLSDIWTEASKDLDESIAFPDVLSLVNRALDDLTPIADKEMKKTTDIVPTNTYELPADLHRIRSVVINQVEYEFIGDRVSFSRGYQLWGDEITVLNGPDSGTVELYYYKKLTRLTNATDEPEIEPEYHDLFILFIKANLTKDNAEKRQELLAQYESRKKDFAAFKSRFKRRKSVRIVHNW